MSLSQLILLVLVVVAFAIGWVGRGRREHTDDEASLKNQAAKLDETIGYALTCFQAVLALWRIEGGSPSARARRAIETFERHRAVVIDMTTEAPFTGPAKAAITQALAALDRLEHGVVRCRDGAALSAERERTLLGAERTLGYARTAFLHAILTGQARARE